MALSVPSGRLSCHSLSCALTYLAELMGMTESPVSQREQRNQEEFGGEVDRWNFN